MPSNTRSPSTSTAGPVQASPLGELIRGFVAPLHTVLGELEPLDVPLPDAVDVLHAFIDLEHLAAAGRVLMAGRAAESSAWQRAGSPSAADWLARLQGTSTGQAHNDLRTSRQLGQLPETAGEVRAGNLSADQAAVITDGASVNPAAESDLIDTAKSDSLKHTKEQAARRKAEVEAEATKVERERRARVERKARFWTDQGRWKLFLEGPLDTGAAMQQALQNRIGDLHRQHAKSPGQREERDQYAYDAEHDLICNDAVPDAAKTTTAKRLMLVRVDLAALVNGHVGPGEVCEIPGIDPISVDAARQLFGDSILRLITTNGPAVIDVITPSHRPTAAQQIAKLWTDPKCVVAGCNHTVRLEYEHRDDFARTRQTVLVNLEHMCKFHHDLKTLDHWQLIDGTGRRAFVAPDHPLHPHNTTPSDLQERPHLLDTG